MAKKEREALAFVKKANGSVNILFAVVGMPSKTTYPAEASYIVYNGDNCKRQKLRINAVRYDKKLVGSIVVEDRTKVVSSIPNFIEVKGQELQDMHAKCSLSFKRSFPLK